MKKHGFVAVAVLAMVLALLRLGAVAGYFVGPDYTEVMMNGTNFFGLIVEQIPNNLLALFNLLVGGAAFVLAFVALLKGLKTKEDEELPKTPKTMALVATFILVGAAVVNALVLVVFFFVNAITSFVKIIQSMAADDGWETRDFMIGSRTAWLAALGNLATIIVMAIEHAALMILAIKCLMDPKPKAVSEQPEEAPIEEAEVEEVEPEQPEEPQEQPQE